MANTIPVREDRQRIVGMLDGFLEDVGVALRRTLKKPPNKLVGAAWFFRLAIGFKKGKDFSGSALLEIVQGRR
ncbi:MAG: hypothetical protein KZQ96_21260 [Candidatus Thiodiazotropha sp. (ex Lucinoma borealis)]|nr:hypothetical protein [Candidatus Thiodiazotropha sp. (ex Lucinoma borealis)]